MPNLYQLLDTDPGRPGFLLPLLQSWQRSNELLIQISDTFGNITRFESLFVDPNWPTVPTECLEAEVGRQAIWAFRDFMNEIHTGPAARLKSLANSILRQPNAAENPLVAYELVAFCSLEEKYPHVLTSAYDELRSKDNAGADAWRDAVVILPAVKEDLAEGIRLNLRSVSDLAQTVAVVRDRTVNVYAPEALLISPKSFARTKALGAAFGVTSVVARATKWQSRLKRRSQEVPSWKIIGRGGIARYVVKQPQFNGRVREDFVFAEGAPIDQGLLTSEVTTPLIIGISPSDAPALSTVAEAVTAGAEADDAASHLINIRPIGFGTPKSTKVAAIDVRETAFGVDVVWLMANHRQRQIGSFANSLSASNYASRYLKAALQALIWCTRLPEGQELLSELRGSRLLGLCGAAAYGSEYPEETVQRVLYSMLCEDAHLHTARRIVVFWPYALDSGQHRVRIALGRHTYEVELIPRGRLARHIDVIGLAVGVEPSKRSDEEFRDFCISLLAGFEWNWRFDQGPSMVFENQGAVLQTWCSQSVVEVNHLVSERPEFGGDNMVITNQTVSRALRHSAKMFDWTVLHYSELGRWMKQNYRIGPFKDL